MYSNYYLNQRLNNLQAEVDDLAPDGSYVNVNGDQTINNIKTFTSLPQSIAVPTNNADLTNKLYVDNQIGGGLTLNQVLTNTQPYTATQTFNNTIIANSLITGTITNAQTANVSTNSTVNSGGTGVMYLALTQGTGGNYPIQTNIPTYNASSLVLSAPIVEGTSYITSPLIGTTYGGQIRVNATNGQYSYFQQTGAAGYDLTLNLPPASSHFNIFGSNQSTLPTASTLAGLSIGWDSVPSSGASDFINYAQGGNGGFNFYTLNSLTNSTLIGSIPRFQPALNDISVNLATTKWVSDYVSSLPTGLTLADVHSSTLPFTAQQTFNSGLITQNINATDLNITANSTTLNSTILMKFNTYIPSTAGFNFGDNFSGTNTNGNTFLSQGSGKFQIYNTSNSNLTGQATDIIIRSQAGVGDPLLSTITLQTGTTPNIILNQNLITVSTLSNFSLTPTAPNVSTTNPNELMNYASTQNLISSNAPNFAYINNANNFTNTNDFLSNPTTSATATLSNQIPNLQQIQSLISGGTSGAALLAGSNTFTAQNVFNNFAPQSSVAPTVNNSLVNLQYLNTQLTNLRNIIPLKATQNRGVVSGDFTYSIAVDSWTNYLIDDFITIRYNLSNNFTAAGSTTPSSYTANSWGYCDIYPYRLGFAVAPFSNATNFSVLNNSFNGSTAYNLTSPSLPRGRWFWAYDNNNLTSFTNSALGANGFYLYIQAITSQLLNIGILIPTPIAGGSYTSSFSIELISSLDNSKISTSSFLNNF